MVMRSIWMALLILRIMGAAISGKDDMKEEAEEDVRDYMLAKDYCSMGEFKNMDYYLFCDTQLHEGAGGFKMKPCIISSETQTIEEAKELYQEFKEKLPLETEPDEEGEEDNVTYVSSDCKWVITNKWSEYKTISTQRLFYEKDRVNEKVTETRGGVYPILVVKDGERYKEMDEEQYAKLSEIAWITFYDGGYDSFKKINQEGDLLTEIKDDYKQLTIRRIEDGTEQWSFSLQGIREEVERMRDDIQAGGTILVSVCQFEGDENEGWLTVQAGPSSFFRIAYPSGEVTYLGEYMYAACFSPDGKYVAYSDVDYDNRVDMEPEERKQMPPQGIYVMEVMTGKTAYIYWDPSKNPEEDFMEYRNFMWIEKEGFEEYMSDMRNKE